MAPRNERAPRRKRAPSKSPAFQFYPSNFLGSPKVRAMDAAQIGVYWLLCCIEWEESGFTYQEAEDIAASARIDGSQFAAMWPKLSRCFVDRDGRFYSPRLDSERDKQREWRRKSSKGGKLSAEKRRKGGSTTVEPTPQPTVNTPSLSPSPTPKPTTPPQDALWEEAWAAYPKRPGNSKADTYRQWLKRVKEGVDPLTMLEGALRYRRYVDAEQKDPTYVKQSQTFFGQGKHFESDWTPTAPRDELGDRIAALIQEEDAALEKTRQLLATRGAA